MIPPPTSIPPPTADSPPRKARLRDVASAVLWSFFGVRKGHKLEEDAVSIRLHQVIIVGVAIAAMFVALLLLIANIVVRSAGA